MSAHDVVVIGAGAAGMMCAALAGQRGRRVLLIEHYDRLGEKIRISGGGRCNFTNVNAAPANYLSQNPDFCRSALARFTPHDFIAMVERHGIAYHEKKLGQLFCDGSSTQIIRMLESECGVGKVEWRMPCAVREVSTTTEGFAVATAEGVAHAPAVVIATGGLTVPKIGATAFGYQMAERFGIAVVPPHPALVPLALAPESLQRYGALAGVSVDAITSFGDTSFRENILFTHRGLSGPAILQISSYWDRRGPISIDVAPDFDVSGWLGSLRKSQMRLDNLLAEHLPRRFAQAWCEAHDVAMPVAAIETARLDRAASDLRTWRIQPSGTLGYNKAEVTLGGVDTRGLSSKTMGATAVPGLFFIGEVVDVTGWLGGYNFQWAWASAHAAAMAV